MQWNAPISGYPVAESIAADRDKGVRKPTNSGLLLHYQSHVDNWYEKGLLSTMLDRAHRLPSSRTHFSDECDLLKTVFSRLKYPKHLVNFTIRSSLTRRYATSSSLYHHLKRQMTRFEWFYHLKTKSQQDLD